MNYPYSYYPQQQPQLPMQGRPTYMDLLQQNTSYLGIKGRPVASYDEAKASMIDFDGSIFYFPDAANQKIYTKQINLDGTSSLKVYALVENPSMMTSQLVTQNTSSSEDVVSKDEFNQAINALTDEVQRLKEAMNKHDEPIGANANSTVNQF